MNPRTYYERIEFNHVVLYYYKTKGERGKKEGKREGKGERGREGKREG